MSKYVLSIKEFVSARKEILLLYAVGFLFVIIVLDRLFPPPPLPRFSTVITDKDGNLLSAYLTPDSKWRLRSEAGEVSGELIMAILEKEDRYFYYHPGVNIISVARALFVNTFSGDRRIGASTITMQLARMLDPAPRNYISKLREAVKAVQFELHYSKDEILSSYLSLLPFGGNIEGVKAASFIYFGKPPEKLSLAEAVTLTVIPNDPNSLRLDRGGDQIVKKRAFWLKKFEEEDVFPSGQIRDALEEPIHTGRLQIEKKAPHLSDYLFTKRTGKDIIKTTIDFRIQSTTEEIVKKYVSRIKAKGMSNAAVLILDNRDNSVAAYIGSADFTDDQSAGQVNGIEALRSPGSTLKPSLYAYALDLGIITPRMKMNDIPSNFGGYIPENFDMEFRGEVTMREALLNSLNIPAVKTLQDAGVSGFIDLIERAGANEIKSQRKKLGLSLILGGCGVTLRSLTNLFAVFAAKGYHSDIRYYEGQKLSPRVKIYSEGAVFLISDILSSNVRPDLPVYMEDIAGLSRIAWKTGTSFGKKDAWAIGYDNNYTVGVWAGNFDGSGSPYLTGAEIATPLLFEIFKSISSGKPQVRFSKPPSVQIRDVCAASGKTPGRLCTKLTNDYYIVNVSRNDHCDAEREFPVTADGKYMYCYDCLPDDGYIYKTYRIYEQELLHWMKENGRTVDLPPPHNPDCASRSVAGAPKIISPSPDFDYLVEASEGSELMLQAVASEGVSRLFWYVDNVFFNTTFPGGKLFLKPQNKRIKITCIDDRGRSASVEIKVSYY
ncbi:MAG: penicillin-binding protein 1C [Ignavibacteriaceae bacterium]|nr:penicillin-binding protein 1C [Ignavibacteriaceae bacterium]